MCVLWVCIFLYVPGIVCVCGVSVVLYAGTWLLCVHSLRCSSGIKMDTVDGILFDFVIIALIFRIRRRRLLLMIISFLISWDGFYVLAILVSCFTSWLTVCCHYTSRLYFYFLLFSWFLQCRLHHMLLVYVPLCLTQTAGMLSKALYLIRSTRTWL